MGFQEDLEHLVEQIRERIPHVHGEEATKHALVVPFLQVLGYDVFNPIEVRPEYVADFAIGHKKGQPEKVDYAITINGRMAIFIECKAVDVDVAAHGRQLARYFGATHEVKLGIVTNGVRLRAFSDLQLANVMDDTPWLDIDLTALKPADIDALSRFRKSEFAPEKISELAEEMAFYQKIREVLAAQLQAPNESFVRWMAGEIPGVDHVTKKVVERLTPILQRALQATIVEHVTRSLVHPSEATPTTDTRSPAARAWETRRAKEAAPAIVETVPAAPLVVLQCFDSLSQLIRESDGSVPLAFRASRTYFAVHQNNVRRWFLRLSVEEEPLWVAFRHVPPEELRTLAPGFEDLPPGAFGDSRIALKTVQDLPKLRAALILACQREAARDQVSETAVIQ